MKHPTIEGLFLIPEFISQNDEMELVMDIDKSPWLSDLSRRVQHYGWKYDYRFKQIDISMKLDNFPYWVEFVSNKIYQTGLVPHKHDQVIINEYLRNQSISKHIDCVTCFKDGIASLSLLEEWEMTFTHVKTSEKIRVLLPARSLVVLTGQARYDWTHEIPKRLTEPTGLVRGRRLSLTLRSVILK